MYLVIPRILLSVKAVQLPLAALVPLAQLLIIIRALQDKIHSMRKFMFGFIAKVSPNASVSIKRRKARNF